MVMLAAALAFLQPQTSAAALSPCTPEHAEATTVEAITTAPQRWLDRCVTISGISGGIELFSSVEGMYRTGRFAADGNFDPADLRHRIGIDRQELRGNAGLRRRATQIRVTGRVDSCERRFQRVVDAGGVPFLGGYCHSHKGPTIIVSDYAISNRTFQRLVGDAARQRVGDLIEVPVDWEWRDELEKSKRDFASAVRAGDRHRLSNLLSYGSGLEEKRITHILTAPAYQELREGRSGEVKILSRTVGGRFKPSGNGYVSAYFCYCRTRNCSGRWPIASVDADAGEERPYVCVNVSGRIADPPRLEMYAPDDGGWLAEPRRR
jgi:hypothetical protein